MKVNDSNDSFAVSEKYDSDSYDELDDSVVDETYAPSEAESDMSDVPAPMQLSDESGDDEEDEEIVTVADQDASHDNTAGTSKDNKSDEVFQWTRNLYNYVPRMKLPSSTEPIILANVNRKSSELDTFFALFPKQLFELIAKHTNRRLEILRSEKQLHANVHDTNADEMMIILGCTMVMSYNHLPALHMYWSTKKSMGNTAIREAVSRDRFQILFSKLYFNEPKKPEGASKTYYMDEIMACLKNKFLTSRSDSTYQSIDESMTKFKGRSSLKQYMPMKPVKRGIKLWTRCDAVTGYVYDTNIYCGKEMEKVEGTLGERVVNQLVSTVTSKDVVFSFDRFFTSTKLLSTLPYAALGTFIKTRRNTPTLEAKFKERGEWEMSACTDKGILGVHWKDTKDVYLLTNCNEATVTTTYRKMKDGSKKEVSCPVAMEFYNKYMGGVDHADQMITLYELDRKSQKWWRKVFFRLLMTAVHNAYIIYNETNHRKSPYITFLSAVAEGLLENGRKNFKRKRTRKVGRHSRVFSQLEGVGEHLPVKAESKRLRCVRCKRNKKEKRTNIQCLKCNVALCMECFTPEHT